MAQQDLSGWLSAARTLALAPDDPGALAWLATGPPLPDRPPPAPPADLSARLLDPVAAAGAALERSYHARWLWHLLAPEDADGWPLVSVVIPVYERHELLLEAVASVLRDGYPRLEFCICDDASRQDPLPLLAHLGERLRYRRLASNGGPAVARQAALALARGELVQFLDADDLLLPGALADKVAALAAVPDAELCFDTPRLHTEGLAPGDEGALRRRIVGGPACASQEGPRALVRTQPFLPTAVLVARHRMLAVGFDTTLRFHEDRLAFARLGLAGIKCVGLKEPRTLRRWLPSSFSRAEKDTLGQLSRVLLHLLGEALERPHFWPACGALFAALFDRGWGNAGHERRPEQRAAFECLLHRLEQLAGAPPAGLSGQPLLADLAAALRRTLARRGDSAEAGALLQRLDRLAALASPPGPADLALWREAGDPATVAGGLGAIFAAQSRALRRGEAWVPLADLDQRPFRSIPHPAKRRWKLLARLAARWLG
jgi:hypothetical protein